MKTLYQLCESIDNDNVISKLYDQNIGTIDSLFQKHKKEFLRILDLLCRQVLNGQRTFESLVDQYSTEVRNQFAELAYLRIKQLKNSNFA